MGRFLAVFGLLVGFVAQAAAPRIKIECCGGTDKLFKQEHKLPSAAELEISLAQIFFEGMVPRDLDLKAIAEGIRAGGEDAGAAYAALVMRVNRGGKILATLQNAEVYSALGLDEFDANRLRWAMDAADSIQAGQNLKSLGFPALSPMTERLQKISEAKEDSIAIREGFYEAVAVEKVVTTEPVQEEPAQLEGEEIHTMKTLIRLHGKMLEEGFPMDSFMKDVEALEELLRRLYEQNYETSDSKRVLNNFEKRIRFKEKFQIPHERVLDILKKGNGRKILEGIKELDSRRMMESDSYHGRMIEKFHIPNN